MTTIEIVLLLGGALIFALGFIVPESVSGKGEEGKKAEERIDRIIRDREDEIRNRIRDIVDETREQAEDDTRRELERISNEKIMAVNDYSKVVMDDIEKNHKEVMFLYDMLDHKSADLKNTIRKADSVGRTQSAPRSGFSAAVPPAQMSSAPGSPARVSGMDRLRGRMNAAVAAPAPAPAPASVKKTETQADSLRKVAEQVLPPVEPVKPQVEMPEEKRVSVIPVPEVKAEETPVQEVIAPVNIAEEDNSVQETAPEEVNPAMSRNEKVRAMHRDGAANVDIAKTLGMGVGEVNLIIDLYESDQEDLA
ncbi:hypothetical protein SAMN06296386_108152 [Lachnospiraceae bacterium]|nr:hypothetical protein SAMN06296386_108152 [Lachnospiraceae bacterium]